MMEVWGLQLFNGLSLSSIMLLIALGLALSFGLMNVINLAHGEFIMLGPYTVYGLQLIAFQIVGDVSPTATFIIAIPLSFMVAAGVGMLVEADLIRFLYRRPLDTLLATVGVGIFLQQLARSIFGAPNVQVVAPFWLSGGLEITGDLVLPIKRLFIIAPGHGMYRRTVLVYVPLQPRAAHPGGDAEPGDGFEPGSVDPAGRQL